MSETPIRVLVADDHAIVREGIRAVLEQGTGFEVVAEASDGEEALRVLLDVLAGFGLPDARVVDSARALRSALHGFVTLEGAGGFGLPRDVTRSYRFLVDTLIAGFEAAPPARTSAP